MNQPSPCIGVVVVVVIIEDEDEEDTRELLRELLESRGHRVATARDGIDGLALLRSTSDVCFVLLDLVMPRMDGFEVLRHVAREPALAALTLCVSTSAPERAPAEILCAPKPIDTGRLFALIDAHCIVVDV